MGNFPNPIEPINKTLDYGHEIILNAENIGERVSVNAEIIVSDGITDTISTAQLFLVGSGIILLYALMKIDIDKASDIIVVPFKTVGEVAKKLP